MIDEFWLFLPFLELHYQISFSNLLAFIRLPIGLINKKSEDVSSIKKEAIFCGLQYLFNDEIIVF